LSGTILFTQHDPAFSTNFNRLHVARDLELFSLSWKYSVSNHFYGTGIVLDFEVFYDQKRGRSRNSAVNGDFLVFVIPRVVENILDLGSGSQATNKKTRGITRMNSRGLAFMTVNRTLS